MPELEDKTSNCWKTVRVFISSTFRDMHAERDHLVRFVFPRLREQLLPRRIHLVDVDLRWGVTSEQDASEVCREIINECRPRFLCMLGGRYGWVPPGKTRSITADEVHYGVLDRTLKDRGFAYFYFREDAATAAMVETTPGEFREPQGSDNQKKLTELKLAIVATGLNPFMYQAQWDNDSRRLTGLKQFGDRVYDDLLASMKSDPELQDRFVTDIVSRPDEFDEENAAMEAFVEERSERFVLGSRDKVLNKLIDHTRATGGKGYVCLTGASGSGKSALLAHLYRHLISLSEFRQSAIIIAHFVGASPGSTDVRRTLRLLCHELKAGCPDITADIPDDPEKLRVAFSDFLRQACEKRRVVILLDAVNQFDSTSHSSGLHWLPGDLPPNARVIVSALLEPRNTQTTRNETVAETQQTDVSSSLAREDEGGGDRSDVKSHPAMGELRRRLKPHEIELKPLTAEDADAVITQFLDRHKRTMTNEQRAALRAKPDAGTPLYLLAALEELRTLSVSKQVADSRDQDQAVLGLIVQLPPMIHELFAWILKRLENDDGFRDAVGRRVGRELVSRFASLLGASRYGLSQRELADLLAPGNAKAVPPIEPDPQGNVAALLYLLRPYLMLRGELLDFYHGQFREATKEAWLNTDAQRKAAHTQLAGYFHGQDNFLESLEDQRVRVRSLPPTPRPANRRKAEELVYQRLKVLRARPISTREFEQAYEALENLLTDLFFLEAKTEAGYVFELTRDFSDLVAVLPEARPHHRILRLLKEAFRRDIHFIARHPTTLFQCIWNTCWWYDCSEARNHYQAADGTTGGVPPWQSLGAKIYELLETWRLKKDEITPGFRWLRSLRPPSARLGSGQVALFRGHGGFILSVKYSSDGRSLVSGGLDKNVRVWDVDMGYERLVLRGHTGSVVSVDFIASDSLIASGSEDKTLRVWDAQTGQEILCIDGNEGPVNCIAVHPDGKSLITGSNDGTLRVWSLQTGEEIQRFRQHTKKITSIALSPDGTLIASASWDHTISILNVSTGTELCRLRHAEQVNAVAFSPDGKLLASAAGMSIDQFATSEMESIIQILWKPGESKVEMDNSIRVWDVCNSSIVSEFPQRAGARSLAFSSDGKKLAVASGHTVDIWDIRTHSKVNHFTLGEPVVTIDYSPDDRYVAAGSYDGTVRIFDTLSASAHDDFALPSFQRPIMTAAYSPDGQRIATGSQDGMIRIWCALTGLFKQVITGHTGMVPGLCWSPNNRLVVSASSDRTAKVWDADTGTNLCTFRGHQGIVWCVTFSPDGLQVVTGSQDCTARIWDVISGKELLAVGNSEGVIMSVAWSQDSRILALGAGNPFRRQSSIIGIDLTTGKECFFLQGHKSAIRQIAFSPDATRLTSWAEDWTVRHWDITKGKCLGLIEGQTDVSSLTGGIAEFKYSAWSQNFELVIAATQTLEPVGWFPEWLDSIRSQPNGHQWAGASANHLHILQLEGTDINVSPKKDICWPTSPIYSIGDEGQNIDNEYEAISRLIEPVLNKLQSSVSVSPTLPLTPAHPPVLSQMRLKNNRAVDLLRTGQIEKSLEILRGLLFPGDGVIMRDDVPPAIKANFVTALLLKQNIEAAESWLRHESRSSHPRFDELKSAIAVWRAGLSWSQKLGIRQKSPISLTFTPGEVI